MAQGLARVICLTLNTLLLMQENRSSDHYYGTLSGVNGYDSGSPAFQQKGWNPQTQRIDNTATTIPFRFDTTRGPLCRRT